MAKSSEERMIEAGRNAGKWLAKKTPAVRLKEQLGKLDANRRRTAREQKRGE